MAETIIETLAGALLVEVFIAVILYGNAIAQAYDYWWNFPDDGILNRRMVLVVWILDTIHTIFCICLVYSYVILDFDDPASLEKIVWSVGATVVTAVILPAIVQSFFLQHIWIISKHNLWLTAIPSVLLILRIALGLASASLTWKLKIWDGFRASVGPLFTLTCGFSLSAVVDIIISATLLFYVARGQKKSDNIVKSLQRYVINTGCLTMLVSIAIVLTFILMKDTLVFAGLVEIQCKLYANSFIATLNARQDLPDPRPVAEGEVRSIELTGRLPTGRRRPRAQQHLDFFTTLSKTTAEGLENGIPVTTSATSSTGNVEEQEGTTGKATGLV